MKKSIFAGLLGVVILVAALVRAEDRIPSADNLTPVVDLTLFSTTLSNETKTVTTAIPIQVPTRAVGVLQLTAFAENPGTSNLTVAFRTSLDGTRFSSVNTYSVALPLNGTNVLNFCAPFGTNLNARYIALYTIETPQTNLVTISQGKVTFLPAP